MVRSGLDDRRDLAVLSVEETPPSTPPAAPRAPLTPAAGDSNADSKDRHPVGLPLVGDLL